MISADDFKQLLLEKDAQSIVRNHVFYGECFALNNQLYPELKNQIATRFDIHPNQVLVVGSAKIGFSIAPEKRFRAFSDHSDIDVCIVSEKIFESYWLETYKKYLTKPFWPNGEGFIKYFFRGWIRPDMLPSPISNEWFEYFRELTSSSGFGPYKISAGLYKSWEHLEAYQINCIIKCIQFQKDKA